MRRWTVPIVSALALLVTATTCSGASRSTGERVIASPADPTAPRPADGPTSAPPGSTAGPSTTVADVSAAANGAVEPEPLPIVCPSSAVHESLGTYTLSQLPSPAGGLSCSSTLDEAGGGLMASRSASGSPAFGTPVGRELVERWIVCVGGNCPSGTAPITSYAERVVERGDGGLAVLVEYERDAEAAGRVDLVAGMMAAVLVEFDVGDLRCSGIWTGRGGPGVALEDALDLTIDLAHSLCGAMPTHTSLGPPPSTTMEISDSYDGATDVGVTDARTSDDLDAEEALDWARVYLTMLADGDWHGAATLLSRPSPPEVAGERTDRSLELAALGIASPTTDLDGRLATWCGKTTACSAPLDPFPGIRAFPNDCEGACVEMRSVWLHGFDGEPNREWWVSFALTDDDGQARRPHPSSARPLLAVLAVGAVDGRVYVRGLPPDPAHVGPSDALPQLQPIDGSEVMRLHTTDDGRIVEVEIDRGNLCVRIDRPVGGTSSICEGPASVPLSGMLWISDSDGPGDPDAVTLLVVDPAVSITVETGSGIERSPAVVTPVGNGSLTAWLWEFGFDPHAGGPLRITYALPDGTEWQR